MPPHAARPRSARRAAALTLVTVAASGSLAACSNREAAINKNPHPGNGTATMVNGVQQIEITTGIDYRFHPSTLVVHEGKVRIVLANRTGTNGGPPHDLRVNGLPGAYVPLVAAGETREITFTAPAPGRYGFVCTIHVAQGQTGTLIVKAGPPT